MINLVKIGKKLFPINRSLTGKGNLKTLKILKYYTRQLKIKHFKTNKKVYDWKIPNEWNVNQAYVRDKFGKKIIDFKRNNLHLISYSQYFNKKVKKNLLIKHLYSNPNLKKAIPYITSYYKKNWGFCINHYNKIEIIKKYKSNDFFKILIDSKFKKNGKMHYGEIYLPGVSKEEILITTYICHPSMVNNELSGPLVALALTKFFSKKKYQKSIRILFVPETIGAIAYIRKNIKSLKKNVIGGFVITCIGDNKNYSLLLSKYSNSNSDKAAKHAYKKLGLTFKKYSFLNRGSDERQFNSPHINLGLASIMRSKYGTFKEYHSSLDNFNLVTQKGLEGGYKVVKEAILNLMKIKFKFPKRSFNKKYPISKFICEPQLGKRNLYPQISNISYKNKNKKIKLSQDILNFLQYADGSNSIKEISKYINLPLKKSKNIYNICKTHKLMRK